MMNIQVNSSLQGIGKSNNSGANTEVVMLQPAVVDDDPLSTPQTTPKQRRRARLSEEAEANRKDMIALRMREKRANETEEQKVARRLREADRMKRKRANESEDQKQKRRAEAALRARLRRANMSPEERNYDRKKAAERMRLRRKNETTGQKAMRRLKAAERMRRRRASETPEQRAQRRQSIALRMKARRRRKDEKAPEELPPLSPGTLVRGPRIVQVSPHSPSEILSDAPLDIHRGVAGTQLSQTSHIVVTSDVGDDVALVNVDPSMLHGNIISGVELASLTPLPLSIKQPQVSFVVILIMHNLKNL